MNWFRICMETPDDGAGGGSEEPAAPEFQSAFSPEGWKGDPPEATPEPVEEPEPEGEEEPEPEEPPAAQKPEAWSDDDWSAFQKQFPGGSEADLWKHYSNLRAAFSRGEHKQPAEPEEPEFEEPPSWRAHNFQSLGAIPTDGLSAQQRTELGDLLAIDPRAAAHWAIANQGLLKEDEFSAIQNTWFAADPYGARNFWQQMEDHQRQQAQAEEFGPRMAVVDAQQQVQGLGMAIEAHPLMEQHRVEFGQWIEDNPHLDDQLTELTDPVQIQQALVTLFNAWYAPQAMTRLQEMEAAEQQRLADEQTAAEEAQAAIQRQQRGARTATSSAPAAPAGGEANPDDIRAAIREAARGTVPQRG